MPTNYMQCSLYIYLMGEKKPKLIESTIGTNLHTRNIGKHNFK